MSRKLDWIYEKQYQMENIKPSIRLKRIYRADEYCGIILAGKLYTFFMNTTSGVDYFKDYIREKYSFRKCGQSKGAEFKILPEEIMAELNNLPGVYETMERLEIDSFQRLKYLSSLAQFSCDIDNGEAACYL